MIRISRFFLPFLCCLTAPALAGTQTRWEVVPDSTAIVWNVREGDSHRDHIEMSGLRISAVLRYGVGADGSFRFERSIVWPMLRTIPNNTHGSLMRRFVWDVPRMLSVNENCLQQEKVRRIVLDGTMTVESDWTAVKGSLSLTRVLFPSVDEAAFCEKYILKNTGEKPLYVEIPRARSVIRTAPAKGVEGSYELVAEICGDTALMLAPRAEVAFGAFFSGRRSGDEALALNADAECAKRRALVAEWQRNLVLDTPDPVIDAMFAFAKIRAAESIYDTKGGLMHGPGGERFYAAIWANDQAEYINPFFPFLGYDRGNRSALCSFGYFARYMNPDYRPIPSSIIAEGTDIWNGAGDRGDAAMIAYGAARYALARGDAAEAAEAQGAERTVERQTGFTAEEAVFLKCAGVGVKAAFELKADLIAVAEVFRALQAPAGAEVEAGAELKLIVRLLISNLGVGVDEAFIDHTIKLNIGSNSAARKSAENGERSESLFHD